MYNQDFDDLNDINSESLILKKYPINDGTALVLLIKAVKFDMKKLKERSMRHIEQNPYTALWSILNTNNYRRFVNIPYGVLRCILQSERLRVEEKDLWHYAFSWAQHECDRKDLPRSGHNIRLVLGDLFSLIKFPLISKAGFTNIEKCGIVTFDGSRSTGKMYSGVFTGQELDEMHNYYATGERPTFMSDFQFIPRECK